MKFKKFFESVGGSYLSSPGKRYGDGKYEELPDYVSELPTFQREGQVWEITKSGKTWKLKITSGITALINEKKWKYMPRKPKVGDRVTLVFYLGKEKKSQNWTLKTIKFIN